jgi:phage FluMu protein gp41
MNRVRAEVWSETKNQQMPWVNTSLIGEFILNPQLAALGPDEHPTPLAAKQLALSPPLVTPNQDRLAQENRLWDSAEHSNSADDNQAVCRSAWRRRGHP